MTSRALRSVAGVLMLAVTVPTSTYAQVRRVQPRAPVTQATIQKWKLYLSQHPTQGSYPEWNQIAPERAVSELTPLLFDIDPAMRAASANAIGSPRPSPASGASRIAAAMDSASDVESKVEFAHALEDFEPSAAAAPAVPALIRALRPTASVGVANEIVFELAQIGPAA